ncbi:MAG: hypothetical protein ACRD8O_17355 [Bryobacteraceae bacterium]
MLREARVEAVELSALRIDELEPLVSAIPELDLRQFSFVSIHAPSRFTADREGWVVDRLSSLKGNCYPIVVHPDVLYTPALWNQFGDALLVENMDKRKPIGRNVREMQEIFESLPAARFCFDIGHVRQVDPSMTEASLLLHAFGDRLAEVHISEVNTASRHDPISRNAVIAFRRVAMYIPEEVPVILETLIDVGQSEIRTEIQRAREALNDHSPASL